MNWHTLKVKEAVKKLDSVINTGLSQEEASKRLKNTGENSLPESKSESWIAVFFGQFKDTMILILVAAAVISLVTGIISGEGDIADPVMIMFIVVFNGIIGTIQQLKAEKALEALKNMYFPEAKALREGKIREIPAKFLVQGDIIYLSSGDIVPADCRIIETNSLTVSEASLTGESEPVGKEDIVLDKKTPLAERKNMLYMGTNIVSGHTKAIVTETGISTEIGKIAKLMISTPKEDTPLQKKLSQTGKVLGVAALGICILIFAMGIMKKTPVFRMFITSVSLAVAAIPEGLPAIVTVMLSIGVQKMAKKKAVIRHLPAVETLGCATVICTDKTGTLTGNVMTVTHIDAYDKDEFVKYCALCTDSIITPEGITGEPTENALVSYALEKGFDKNTIEDNMPRVGEVPFDSQRKLMTTLHKKGEKYISITKGAPEILIKKCSHYIDTEGKKPMTATKRIELSKTINSMAEKGLRILAAAVKEYENIPESFNNANEKNLTFIGLAGLSDPPRPQVRNAIDVCRRAGILPVMITGDNPLTAKAIGEKTGLVRSSEGILTGVEIEEMTDKELENNIYKYKIYARVSPEHKLRIVRAFKKQGETVAMTGDGVNDAPALKAADIGCAMGISGTETAKAAADMILADDNFTTIVEAVKEGRCIYSNIRKAVRFLLSSNIGEIITVFTGMLICSSSPLGAIQLLWVNLVTDSLPAIALGLDPCGEDIMHRKPFGSKSLFTGEMWWDIALQGCMIGMLALTAYGMGRTVFRDETAGRTMCLCVLSISQLVHAFNMRSSSSVFESGLFENVYLDGAFILGTVMQVLLVQCKTFNNIFHICPLSPTQWLTVTFLCIMPLILVEIQKATGK